MITYPIIQLKKDKEKSPKRFHPWIFSGAIQSFDVNLKDGDIVRVHDFKEKFLCVGHFYHGSIAVKILSFKEDIIDQVFWNSKIKNAVSLRKNIGISESKNTNCFRLIHAEGDNCPGLIIDIYNKTAVIQCHSIGMHRSIHKIKVALQNEVKFIDTIYDKSKDILPPEYAATVNNTYIYGSKNDSIAIENGNKFHIDIEEGQKTGFFLDQRENRNLLGQYCNGKSVLNTYCYSGGFSIYALNNNANMVVSVDSSRTAMNLVDENLSLNFPENKINHQAICDDVFHFFKTSEVNFDVIILDPPAFAKSINKRHNAIQAYKRLNAEGLKRINRGGIIFTFSCSQVVDKELFYSTVMSAAIEAKRDVKILHYLSQPADHPINIFHPESSYLKGLVLYVN